MQLKLLHVHVLSISVGRKGRISDARLACEFSKGICNVRMGEWGAGRDLAKTDTSKLSIRSAIPQHML